MASLLEFWEFVNPYLTIFIDIILVAFLIYQGYRILSRSRAVPVLFGFTIFLAFFWVSQRLHLDTLSWIFENVSTYLIIAVIVVLQPELRRIFYRMGEGRLFKGLFANITTVPVEDISQALMQLATEKTGAIIILVNKVGLNPLIEGGIQLHANLSRELLLSIFYDKNPLHDGAVVIEGRSILAAATYLPLSSSPQLKRTHGARHRAGLGIAEESDALSLIVSEEKGKISVAYLGELKENIDGVVLKSILVAFNNNKLAEEWGIVFKGTK